MLFCLGISSILNVIATQHREDEKYIFSSANFLLLCSAIIASVFILFFYILKIDFFENPQFNKGLLIYLPSIFFIIITPHLTLQLVYYKKVKQMGISIVVTNVLRILLLFIAVYYIKSLSALLFSLVIIYAFQFLLYNIILLKDVAFYSVKFKKKLLG